MRVAVTGTPGTGKTTACDRLSVPVVHLNDVVREKGLWSERDEDRDSLVVDLDAVREWLDDDWVAAAADVGADVETDPDAVVVESHLAHYLDADRVVVLRCAPAVLEDRLEARGESPEKAKENAESEALDVVLAEAVEFHGEENVYEIDATERSPRDVATEIEATIRGDRAPSAGTVDFTDYL